MNFVILPNLIALAVLVAVFWAISRKATSERLKLWLTGWVLVLLHFAALFLSFGQGPSDRALTTISIGTLLLAGIAFLVSVSDDASTRQLLALCIAGPTVIYATAAVWGLNGKSFYFGIVVAGVLYPWLRCARELTRSKLRTAIAVVASGATLIAGWSVSRLSPQLATIAIFAILNFAIAVRYARAYRRLSTGVVTTVMGFALWGSVFPVAVILRKLAPGFRLQAETWNIPEYLVAVGMILTLFEDQIETSRYHAYHDELTGLPNRRLLDDRLGLALAYARRAKTKLAVLQLDLDRFKEINDTYGHRAGDVALREIASRLAACVRPGDTLARSGGDEFTLVSQFEDKSSAEAIVLALETTLAAPVLIEGTLVQTGLSIGIAVYPDDGCDQDQLHASADRAMYAAKRAGRTSSMDDTSAPGLSNDPVTMMPTSR